MKITSGIGEQEIARANKLIETFQIANAPPIFAIGSFDDRVTVLTQQKRALNLAWALIEGGVLPTKFEEKRCRIAVLGAGIAGLTFAAALIKKHCNCAITLFEERDTLLPLQQGSDTRWLHPHIYDWPAKGSDAVAAMLPVLNWTAARASDVVVQALSSWSELLSEKSKLTRVELWCNARHLQLREEPTSVARLEWVGERRDPATGRAITRNRDAQGRSAEFDMIVMAVGFGIETLGFSYWRNEILGQPGLEQRPSTYLVSGQGDGAIIDLLRLKVSQFRQDRILAELFGGSNELIEALRGLRERFLHDQSFSLYEAFDAFARPVTPIGRQMDAARKALGQRLRRDTDVILQTLPNVRSVSDLLGPGTLKASFQNALLLYLLYRCGGFTPASGDLDAVAARFKVTKPYIVRRHGTDRLKQFQRILPSSLYEGIAAAWDADYCATWRQDPGIQWSGGYFGTPGREADYAKVGDKERAIWRKEYIPGPTALAAASIAGAAAGHLLAVKPTTSHLRLTLHRVICIHEEDLLQQACNYVGVGPLDSEPTIGRTFPARNATIGQAYVTRRSVRSRPAVPRSDLTTAMQRLKLNSASRRMARDVHFLAAIPILQQETRFYGPSPVCAVLYFDSRDDGFDLSEAEFAALGDVVARAFEATSSASECTLDRIDNIPLRDIEASAPPAEPLDARVAEQLMLVETRPPVLNNAFVLNFDHSDLTPLAR